MSKGSRIMWIIEALWTAVCAFMYGYYGHQFI